MRVHLIGVAGTAMASLASLLRALGHEVTGSDQDIYPPMSDELARIAVAVRTPYAAANLGPQPPDLTVIGNAIARGNPELEACLDANLPYTSQAEAIEDLVLPGRVPIVVTGTHGKTTTTALIAWMLTVAGREPGYLVGGMPHDLPASAAIGRGPEFVIEGDEYDTAYFDKRPKFHHYRPRVLVIGNLEHDHVDIYPDLEALSREFRRLVHTMPRTGLVAVGGDSAEALATTATSPAPVVRFGLGDGLDLQATELRHEAEYTHFIAGGLGRARALTLPLPGRHNVLNAMAALAVADHLGLPDDRVAKAFATFRGVKRRLELIGRPRDIAIYDDFAHHPTAIRETLRAVRARSDSGRLWAILEPRSWSMRRNVHQEALPGALAEADVVVMTAVFQADRVPSGQALDVGRVLAAVAAAGREAHFAASVDEVVALTRKRAAPGDALVLMSNGGFGGLHRRLVSELQSP